VAFVLVGLAEADLDAAASDARSVARCHRATREEVARLVTEGHQEPEALAIFDQGDACLVQLLDGRFAGLVWVSARPAVELLPGVSLHIPEDAVYSCRTWTHPAFRGEGLQSVRHRAILDFAREAGRHRFFAYVKSTNFESLKGVRKSGCKPIGKVQVNTRNGQASFTVTITDPAWSAVRGVEPEPDAGRA
jgi:RimJ/RimL family protein N-acetyltransferase